MANAAQTAGLENARELVRRALCAADNGNHAGEQAILKMVNASTMLDVSPHALADMLRESEPLQQPDDGDTEMTITVEDARRLAWALFGIDRDEIMDRVRAALSKASDQ